MKLEAQTAFGTVYSDERVPPDQIWMYSKPQLISPQGELPEPQFKIQNLGRQESGLWWVVAPPG